MVRPMVSETISNSRFRRNRTSSQETGASRLKTTSSTLSPSTRKSDRSLVLIRFFSAEVAESEFRTQPVATVVSATGGVDTTPLCTRADAHFFSFAQRSAQFTALFQCGHTALAQGKRNLCCAFFCTHFHLVCHVLVRWSARSIPSGHVLYLLSVKNLSVLNLLGLKWSKPLCLRSLEWNV